MFDIDLGYRKYSMTTGWIWQAQAADASTEPGLIHFDPIDVDFARFVTAQTLYTGAISGMVFAGAAGMAASLLAMMI